MNPFWAILLILTAVFGFSGTVAAKSSKPVVSKSVSSTATFQPEISVVDKCVEMGLPSGVAFRKKLARIYGVKNYRLTAAKNRQLLRRMVKNPSLAYQVKGVKSKVIIASVVVSEEKATPAKVAEVAKVTEEVIEKNLELPTTTANVTRDPFTSSSLEITSLDKNMVAPSLIPLAPLAKKGDNYNGSFKNVNFIGSSAPVYVAPPDNLLPPKKEVVTQKKIPVEVVSLTPPPSPPPDLKTQEKVGVTASPPPSTTAPQPPPPKTDTPEPGMWEEMTVTKLVILGGVVLIAIIWVWRACRKKKSGGGPPPLTACFDSTGGSANRNTPPPTR